MQQMTALWTKLSARQRTSIGLLALLTVSAVIGLVALSGRPDYALLYSDLSEADAGKIVEGLRARRARYRITSGGSAIEVDRSQVYPLRLALAQEGIPQATSSIGFEIFDKSGLPGSEFSNQVSYQRAVQGELERTIASLAKVQRARAHIVLPRYDLYSGDQTASASVMIQTRGEQPLTQQEADGIAHLVASAVQGLDPQAVTLIDARGRILTSAESAAGGKLTLSQMAARQEYEGQLQRALQTMLDRSVGENNAIVQVKAELDFDEQHTKTKSLTPSSGDGRVVEETTSLESYTGSGPRGGAVAGISANVEAGASASGPGSSGTYTNRQESRQYDYTREERELVRAPGAVKRLTVAVVIDSELPANANRQVEALVRAGAGINEQRGDQVVVERMELAAKKQAADSDKEAEAERAARRRGELLAAVARYGVPLLTAALIGGAALIAARQLRGAGMSVAAQDDGVEVEISARTRGAARSFSEPSGATHRTAEDESAGEYEEAAQRLAALAKENPRAVAQQIRRLLGEAGGGEG